MPLIPGLDPNLQLGAPGNPFSIAGARLTNQADIGHDPLKVVVLAELGVREVDGYREHWTQNESEAVRVFDVPWGNRYAFRDTLLGYTSSIKNPAGDGGLLLRSLPAAHPEQPWLFASRVELVQGIGATIDNPTVFAQNVDGSFQLDGNGLPIPIPMIAYHDTVNDKPGFGRYAVTYSARDYNVRGDVDTRLQPAGELSRYVSRYWAYSITTLPLGSLTTQLYFYGADAIAVGFAGQNVPEPGFKLFSLQQLTYVWRELPDVPEQAINDCVGHVNGNPFDGAPGASTYPAGTLLCQAPLRERTPRSPVGRVQWTVTFKLDYRRQGWNTIAAIDGKFYPAGFFNDQAQAANNPAAVPDQVIFPTADFGQLFKVPAPVKYE